jgi:hypothetical protein
MSASSEWESFAAAGSARRPQRPVLVYFLAFVFFLFVGILLFCYAVTKRTNPVFLDEHGKPVAADSHTSHH